MCVQDKEEKREKKEKERREKDEKEGKMFCNFAPLFKKVKLREGIPGALGRRKTSRKSIYVT
jgi:hypothetical protein